MIFNMLKFNSHFIAKNVYEEHFITEKNQCCSRIFLYQFYWACHFRSANFKEFEGILRNFKEILRTFKGIMSNMKEL